ncbi:hypothetical protein G4Y79_04745 [Phototrophicus methaneseepsis]|uniref:Hen1 N-terminal domain-containing protein n=1 Tax=Phototrophicus methaneseepsis TaxID=2710758 RepID=A0A7S8EB50_9CHLR|nr:hypothetical protein G4Y79_04745 [Phototrophicus methaneseepsis]
MFGVLTITTTYRPATDLGYLLHKHPARVQTFKLAFGEAHVFYPEATEERCTAALLLDINPIGLVRGKRAFAFSQYVNDRPYVASSFLSVVIAQVYRSALNGTCKDRPELVETPIPLEVTISVMPSRGGEALLTRLFEPLGYMVTAVIRLIPITCPFPNATAHGVKSIVIGWVAPRTLYVELTKVIEVAVVGGRWFTSPGIGFVNQSASRTLFPFSFCRQTIKCTFRAEFAT